MTLDRSVSKANGDTSRAQNILEMIIITSSGERSRNRYKTTKVTPTLFISFGNRKTEMLNIKFVPTKFAEVPKHRCNYRKI